jgi:hypothetical protein
MDELIRRWGVEYLSEASWKDLLVEVDIAYDRLDDDEWVAESCDES